MLFEEFSKSFVKGLGSYTSLALIFHLYCTFTKYTQNTIQNTTESVKESPEESSYAQLFEM